MSTTPNQPTGSKIDDRMAMVIEAYYEAVGSGDKALAAELDAAIQADDIDRGIEIVNRREATR